MWDTSSFVNRTVHFIFWTFDDLSRVLAACIILLSTYVCIRWYLNPFRHLAGPTPLPFLGNLLQIDSNAPHKTLSQWATRYGDVFCFKLLGNWTVVLSSADLVHDTVLRQATVYAGRPRTFSIRYLLYDAQNIACQESCPKQRHMRKVGMSAIKTYSNGINRLEDIEIQALHDFLNTIVNLQGQPFDMRPITQASVCSIMTSIILGKRYSSADEEVRQLITVIRFLNDDIHPTQGALLDLFPWLRYFGNSCFKKMQHCVQERDKFVDKQFHKLKESFDPKHIRGIFDLVFESQLHDNNEGDKPQLTDEDVKAIIFDLIGTGTNATSMLLNAFVLILLNHPDVQIRLANEVDKVVGSNRLPSLKDRSAMPYHDAVLLEVLRYLSMAPMLVPRVTTSDTQINGLKIPAHTQVVVNAWSIHHDKRYYDDPWTFNPDRFLNSDGTLQPPDHTSRKSFVGFGVGSRSCIGEHMAKVRLFLFFSAMTQRFTFLPPEGGQVPSDDPLTFQLGYNLDPPRFDVRAVERQHVTINYNGSSL